MIRVEVAYATPDQQVIIQVEVESGSTLQAAIQQSGVLTRFPEIDLAKQRVGLFGKLHALSDFIKEGDRIEIYRPLIVDPKEARRAKGRVRKT